MKIRRFDVAAPIRLGERGGARIDPTTGFLHAPVRLSRTGILLYRKPDGSISRELRHPEDVFATDSLESAKRLVVTRDHPRDGARPVDVTTDNVAKLQKGQGGDSIGREQLADGEDYVTGWVTVTDKATIDEIVEGGRDQVSVGVLVRVDHTPGTYKGQRYDARHLDIVYNHLAVAIARGRAGPNASLVLDSDDASELTDDETRDATEPGDTTQRKKPMFKIVIDGLEVEVADAGTASHIRSALQTRDNEAKSARDEAKRKADELDTVSAERDQLRKDKAEAERKADEAAGAPAVAPEKVREVFQVIDRASRVVKVDEAKVDAFLKLEGEDLCASIRKAVVLEACADEADEIKAKGDAYMEARFDGLVKASSKEDSTAPLAAIVTVGRQDSDDDRSEPKLDSELFGTVDPLTRNGEQRSVTAGPWGHASK